MSAFTPIPLGRPIPDSPHAVSCSLPTMGAVRGYEEKDPAVTRAMTSGYPRFVVHPFARQLASHLAPAGRSLWLTSSERMARELAAHLGQGSGAEVHSHDGIHGTHHPESAETGGRAKLYLQHVGGFISSREAEDHLVRLGLRPGSHPETSFPRDAAAEIRRHLRRAFAGAADSDILLANSGMNAVYAAFRAISDLQAERGRTIWVQLGWLYLDSIAMLEKFPPSRDDRIYLSDVFDRAAMERVFAEKGSRIAGLITEIPTNPLVQTPDVAALTALCRRHGVRLILDPSVASAFSVDVLSFSDLAVTSLTKYSASEGDVIAGAVAVNPAAPDAGELRRRVSARLEPVYLRDLGRLAAQIGATGEVLARIQSNTRLVADFLVSDPRVKDVFWALRPRSRVEYAKVACSAGSVGGIISFTVRGSMEAFYDRLTLAKGPSFGMKTTLISPYMYLAHYDLVGPKGNRAELARSGVDPDLLRLSVGTEDPGDIIAALREALG